MMSQISPRPKFMEKQKLQGNEISEIETFSGESCKASSTKTITNSERTSKSKSIFKRKK